MEATEAQPAQGARARRWLSIALRFGITFAAFGYLSTIVSLDELGAAFSRMPALAWAEMAFWFTVVTLLGAFRWSLLLGAFGADRRPPLRRLTQLYYVGLFYNTILLGVGGDVVRGVASREAFGDSSATAGLSVVFVERVLGLAGLLLLTAGVTLLQPIEGVPASHLLGGVGLLAVTAALAGLLFARRIGPHLPEPLRRLAASVPTPKRYAPIGVVLSIAVLGHALTAVGGHALIVALAPQVALHESLVLIPVALASAFLPTVAGAGVREAAFVALYGLVGVAEGEALAASLGAGACHLAMAGFGGLLALVTPLSPDGGG